MNQSTPPSIPSIQSRNEAQFQRYCLSQIEWGMPVERVRGAYASTLLNPTTAGIRHSRVAPPEPLDVEAATWDQLSRGVQWAIIKLLCENDIPINTSRTPMPFSRAVVVVLGLSRLQIQSFLAVYVDEYEAWIKWDKETAVINWQKLLQLANSRHTSVLDLLPKNRPRLSTDSIPRTAIDDGVSYLRSKKLGEFAGQLSDWIGTNMYGDFIGLKVEAEILHDYLDGKEIRKAACLGWINLKKTHTDLRNKRREEGLPSEVPGGFFFGNFEGDPTPMGYFPGELEELQRDPRNINASQKSRAQNSQRDASRDPNQQLKKRTPTVQESREALRAMERQILRQSRATAPGHIASSATDHDPRYQLMLPGPLRTSRARLATTSRVTVPDQIPDRSRTEAPTQEQQNQSKLQPPNRAKKQTLPQLTLDTHNPETQGTMISKNFNQGSDLALSISHAYSPLRTPARLSVSGRKPSSSPAEERSARFSEIAHGSGTMKVTSGNNRSNQMYSNATFRPSNQAATTPDVQAPANIRNSIEDPDNQTLGGEKETAKTLKRNRKPSRRARDNMESDTEYRPEDDENPQPKKKQKRASSVQKNSKKSVGEQSDPPATQVDGIDERLPTPPQEQLSGLSLAGGSPSILVRRRSAKSREPKNLIFGRSPSQSIVVAAPGRLDLATYAWSSHTAKFASVATTAKFAFKADNKISPSKENRHLFGPTMDAKGLEEARSQMRAYETHFKKLEAEVMGIAGNDADKAQYAGYADSAEYALDAERAIYILGINEVADL